MSATRIVRLRNATGLGLILAYSRKAKATGGAQKTRATYVALGKYGAVQNNLPRDKTK